ncbi:hypothetical protein [Candidatus Albibeggiatoa sp. nov. NOAA]|uniref:hypothetical protein n=1 Tax=Candidatus Albibeggiatoa sp. nov. NOAA TaxID=3162724 RepID=UPI003303161C|nr:hypothetical protein [Thiotrichaceae bacterium]
MLLKEIEIYRSHLYLRSIANLALILNIIGLLIYLHVEHFVFLLIQGDFSTYVLSFSLICLVLLSLLVVYLIRLFRIFTRPLFSISKNKAFLAPNLLGKIDIVGIDKIKHIHVVKQKQCIGEKVEFMFYMKNNADRAVKFALYDESKTVINAITNSLAPYIK